MFKAHGTRLSVCAVFLPLAGCVDISDIASRNSGPDYGVVITQNDCQDIAKTAVAPTLIDPELAQYKFGRCMADTLPQSYRLGIPEQSGYAMNFAVSEKTEAGDYSEFRSHEIVIYNGQVIRRVRIDPQSGKWERF